MASAEPLDNTNLPEPGPAPPTPAEENAAQPFFRRRAIQARFLPKVKRPSKPTLMGPEEFLRGRWMIRGLIGQGGYGEIYKALDLHEGEEVAIKTELRKKRNRTNRRMILEQKVLLRLQGRPHIPKMIASGHDDRMNFIVMEMLSLNVSDLKKQSPVKRLSRSTVGRIMQQAVAGLRDIHTAGFLHRDVKPANMVGRASTSVILLFSASGLLTELVTC